MIVQFQTFNSGGISINLCIWYDFHKLGKTAGMVHFNMILDYDINFMWVNNITYPSEHLIKKVIFNIIYQRNLFIYNKISVISGTSGSDITVEIA